jgi:hypothetical protein
MVVILAGLGAYLYLVELPTERSNEQIKLRDTKLVWLKEEDFTELNVTTGGETIALRFGPARTWTITAPVRTEADQREVQAVIRAVVTGKVARVVEEKAVELAPFGLAKPSAVISMTAGEGKETLSVGDSGPLSNTLYVLRGSDQKLLLTDVSPRDLLNKTLMTLRRKEVLLFDQAEVDRLRLTYPTTEVLLERTHDKPKPMWKIRYPLETEADQTEVRTLLLRLEGLKALGIIDPGRERDALARKLTQPKVKVALHAKGKDLHLKLYQPDPTSGEAFAETAPDTPIFRVNPVAIQDLTRDLFHLQDKRLLGADLEAIAMLSVKTRDEQYVLIRQNNEWLLEDQPTEKLRQETVDLFVSRVVNLPAEERVLKQTGALAPYGLVAPAAEFVATGKDGKVAGRLSLGNQVGGLVYATGQRLSGVYQARADLLTQVPSRTSLLVSTSGQN